MKILAIDTASTFISVAIVHEKKCFMTTIESQTSHSELLLETINNLYISHEITLSSTNLIVIGSGPGSFTSLRIGYAVAKGLALALAIPIVSVSTLHFHSLGIMNSLVLSVLDARKDRYYVALFNNGTRLSDDLDISSIAIKKQFEIIAKNNKSIILTGFGAKKLFDELNSPNFVLDPNYLNGKANYLADLAPLYFEKNGADNDYAGPNYIRLSDAELLNKNA